MSLRDLIAQAEGHELFLQSLHGSGTSSVAFTTKTAIKSSVGSSRAIRGYRGGSSSHGHGRQPPQCQLCRTDGHFASSCPKLPTFDAEASDPSIDLAQAFHSHCHVTSTYPVWFFDSGATDHMITTPENVSKPTPYQGKSQVPEQWTVSPYYS
jgi:hypothetical protein